MINEAEKIDIDKYTDETAEAFTAALANAKSVFENKNTSDAEVEAAERCFVQQLMVCRKRKLIRKTECRSGGNDKTPTTGDTTGVSVVVWMITALVIVIVINAKKRKLNKIYFE